MKKLFLILTVAVLLFSLTVMGLAAEAKPGEEVTVTLTLNNTNAAYVRVKADYDTSVFELISYSANSGAAGGNGIVMYDTKVLPSGAVGTVTLKVRENAAPGTYTVSAALAECYDLDENNGTASVSGGTVTVKGSATPEPTAKPTAEPTAKPTAEPTTKPTAEPTVNPTAEPTAEPTVAPTEEPADDKPQYSFNGVTYNGQTFSGRLVHTEGTGTARKLKVRVTFFITGNYYMSTTVDVEEDGSFEVDAVGPIEYIVTIGYDKGVDGSRFDSTDLVV